jgi:hypothetical protein
MAVIPQQKYAVLPMGEYAARVVGVTVTEGFYGEQLEFAFVVEGGQFDGTSIKGWTSTNFSKKSKLFGWVKAIFGGKPIPEDYALDTEHLLNRRVNLLVTIKAKAETGDEFNKIDSLRAFRPMAGEQAKGNGQQAQAPQQQAQAPQQQAQAGGGLPFPEQQEEDEIPF